MKKKLPIMIGICIFVYAVIFVVILSATFLLPSYVYENDRLIASELNAVNKINYRRREHDGITTVTCDRMTGMDVIWQYNAYEDRTMQLYYTFQVTRGKAKLILVQPGDTSITLTEQDRDAGENDISDSTSCTEQQCTLNLKKGNNKIKIVCEKGTSFSLSFHMDS